MLSRPASLERDVFPHIGASLVPDRLIRRLSKTLQTASRLSHLDYPYPSLSPSTALDTPPATPPEPRFDLDFDKQVRGKMYGTTVEVVEVGRERFAYWCLDALFLLCAGGEEGAFAPLHPLLPFLSLTLVFRQPSKTRNENG
jgi:hypothetical protein